MLSHRHLAEDLRSGMGAWNAHEDVEMRACVLCCGLPYYYNIISCADDRLDTDDVCAALAQLVTNWPGVCPAPRTLFQCCRADGHLYVRAYPRVSNDAEDEMAEDHHIPSISRVSLYCHEGAVSSTVRSQRLTPETPNSDFSICSGNHPHSVNDQAKARVQRETHLPVRGGRSRQT